jgi:hypothetical protein
VRRRKPRDCKSAINLSINPYLSSLWPAKFLNHESTRENPPGGLLSLLSRFFFEIFAVEDIPFTASWWDVTRKRHDLLAHYLVNVALLLKKIV